MSIIIEELQNLHNDEVGIFFTELFARMTRDQLKEVGDSLSKKAEDFDVGYDAGYDAGYDVGYDAGLEESSNDSSYNEGLEAGMEEKAEISYDDGYEEGYSAAKRKYL